MVDSGKSCEDDSDGDVCTNPRAPDGGWGWFCVLGCAICHIVSGGLTRSSGLLFLVFKEKLGRTAFQTTCIVSLGDTLLYVLGPVGSALCNIFSCRTVALVGALLCTSGIILSAVVPKYEFLLFSYGFLYGVGSCFVYIPAIAMVGKYFDKKRSLANGLGTMGNGIGILMVPILIEMMFRHYSYCGAMVLVSGIALQYFVAGCLYRPLIRTTKINAKTRNREYKMDTEMRYVEQDILMNNIYSASDNESDISTKESFTFERRVGSGKNESDATEDDNDGQRICEARDASLNSRDSLADSRNFNTLEIKLEPIYKSQRRLEKNNDGCFWLQHCHCEMKKASTFFEYSLFANACFICYCLCSMLYMGSHIAALTFLPSLAKEAGFTEKSSAVLLAIVGGGDIVGRIISALMDCEKAKSIRRYIYNALFIPMSSIAFLFTVVDAFSGFVVLSALLGVAMGFLNAQKPVIVSDITGPDKIVDSFGILCMFQGIGTGLGSPIAGLIRDQVSSYKESYYFIGSGYFLAALMMLMSNILHARNRRN